MDKKSFVLYASYKKHVSKLTDEQAGQLFKAILAFANDESPGELDMVTEIAYSFISETMERDSAKWVETRSKRVEAGKKGGLAKASNAKQTVANPSKAKQKLANVAVNANVNANANVNVNANADVNGNVDIKYEGVSAEPPSVKPKKPPAKRFTPPSVDEVRAYCKERGNGVDADKFVNYYSSNGWRVGKNPMKDWQAAVRTWERKDDERGVTKNDDGRASGGDSGPYGRVGTYL